MGQAQVEDKKYTIEEWLELEKATGRRYEYHYGEVFEVMDMAGGQLNHSRISGNAYRAIENNFELLDSDCEALTSEVKIQVEEAGRYVYPDTLAVCGELEESEDIVGCILNPVLVVEVTSQSSESYDRLEKFEYYTALPSLKQYMIASQNGPYVTLYNKNPETGKFDIQPIEVRGLDGVIDLYSVSLLLPMKSLYRNVQFKKTSEHLRPVKD